MGTVESLVRAVAAVDWEARAQHAERFLGDDAWLTRMKTRRELVGMGTAAVPALLAMLETDAPRVREFILDTLAWVPDGRSLAAAERFSRRSEPRCVRAAAIRVLGGLRAAARLREILVEPLQRVSPYETSTDWIHVQVEHALEDAPREPRPSTPLGAGWNPVVWNSAIVGRPAPAMVTPPAGRARVLLFVLADW